MGDDRRPLTTVPAESAQRVEALTAAELGLKEHAAESGGLTRQGRSLHSAPRLKGRVGKTAAHFTGAGGGHADCALAVAKSCSGADEAAVDVVLISSFAPACCHLVAAVLASGPEAGASRHPEGGGLKAFPASRPPERSLSGFGPKVDVVMARRLDSRRAWRRTAQALGGVLLDILWCGRSLDAVEHYAPSG